MEIGQRVYLPRYTVRVALYGADICRRYLLVICRESEKYRLVEQVEQSVGQSLHASKVQTSKPGMIGPEQGKSLGVAVPSLACRLQTSSKFKS